MPAKHPDLLLWKDIEGLTSDIPTRRHRLLITPQSFAGKKQAASFGWEAFRLCVSARAGKWDGLLASFNDEDLTGMAAADGGDVARAFRKHNQMLIRWLAQKLGDVETARDIAQGAYLRVLSYSRSQKVENAQALIFKTAANLAANEFRSRKRRGAFAPEPGAGGNESAVERVACPHPTPEEAALSKEEVSATLNAIRALPDRARRAFVLSRFEGKTYGEIAAILGVSESSVEKYIIAALKAVRAAIAEPAAVADVIPLAERRLRR